MIKYKLDGAQGCFWIDVFPVGRFPRKNILYVLNGQLQYPDFPDVL